MPNWCTNSVEITDLKQNEVAEIISKYTDNVIDGRVMDESFLVFDKIITTPKELLERQSPFDGTVEEKAMLESKYGYADWYNWRVDNWGTKWEPLGHYFASTETSVSIGMETAWGPASGILQQLSVLYPEATITNEFLETGAMFMGEVTYVDGEVVSNEYSGDVNEIRLKYPDEFEDEEIEDEEIEDEELLKLNQ